MEGLENVRIYRGHDRFVDSGRVQVGEDVLEADRIFVNVGARAFVPEIPGLAEVDYLTNSGMMKVDFLPDHLMIVGGSYIGLEFGQIYRRFWSKVTVIERGPASFHERMEMFRRRFVRFSGRRGSEFCSTQRSNGLRNTVRRSWSI